MVWRTCIVATVLAGCSTLDDLSPVEGPPDSETNDDPPFEACDHDQPLRVLGTTFTGGGSGAAAFLPDGRAVLLHETHATVFGKSSGTYEVLAHTPFDSDHVPANMVAISDDRLLLRAFNNSTSHRLHVVRIRADGSTELESTVPGDAPVGLMVRAGNYVLAGGNHHNYKPSWLLDVSEPSAPEVVRTDLPTSNWGIYLPSRDEVLIKTSWSAGLVPISVTPTTLGETLPRRWDDVGFAAAAVQDAILIAATHHSFYADSSPRRVKRVRTYSIATGELLGELDGFGEEFSEPGSIFFIDESTAGLYSREAGEQWYRTLNINPAPSLVSKSLTTNDGYGVAYGGWRRHDNTFLLPLLSPLTVSGLSGHMLTLEGNELRRTTPTGFGSFGRPLGSTMGLWSLGRLQAHQLVVNQGIPTVTSSTLRNNPLMPDSEWRIIKVGDDFVVPADRLRAPRSDLVYTWHTLTADGEIMVSGTYSLADVLPHAQHMLGVTDGQYLYAAGNYAVRTYDLNQLIEGAHVELSSLGSAFRTVTFVPCDTFSDCLGYDDGFVGELVGVEELELAIWDLRDPTHPTPFAQGSTGLTRHWPCSESICDFRWVYAVRMFGDQQFALALEDRILVGRFEEGSLSVVSEFELPMGAYRIVAANTNLVVVAAGRSLMVFSLSEGNLTRTHELPLPHGGAWGTTYEDKLVVADPYGLSVIGRCAEN